jgi:hypothetical protein
LSGQLASSAIRFAAALILSASLAGPSAAGVTRPVNLTGQEPVDATPWTPIPVQGCCKVCSKGKACGDSCISRSKTCHKGRGCACDG